MDSVAFQVAVQVRLASHRLARKALLPLGDIEIWQQLQNVQGLQVPLVLESPTVLDWVLGSLRRSRRVQRFLLLCPDCDAEELRPYAEHYGFVLFSGPEHNVLQRFLLALKAYPSEYCFRATGDNPLASGALLDFMVERLVGQPDYYWIRGLPYGFAFELLRSEALCRLGDGGRVLDAGDCEHVTRYIYGHSEQFCLHFEELSELLGPAYVGLDRLRLTLDIQEDWRFLQEFLLCAKGCLAGELPKELFSELLALKRVYAEMGA